MGNWLIFLKALTLAILGWLAGKVRPTSADGQPPGRLEDRLREQLRKEGWKK